MKRPRVYSSSYACAISHKCEPGLKGKYHINICCHFKTHKCLSVNRNNEKVVKFVINHHPSAIKLSISASGQRESRPVWLET